MAYVDAFVLPVIKSRLASYRRMALKAGAIWREHGALEYRECIADDMKVGYGLPFPKLVKPKASEVIFFSWIVYRSRAHRDKVNVKVMKDPRMARMMTKGMKMPFDLKRMSYGGFKVFVEK